MINRFKYWAVLPVKYQKSKNMCSDTMKNIRTCLGMGNNAFANTYARNKFVDNGTAIFTSGIIIPESVYDIKPYTEAAQMIAKEFTDRFAEACRHDKSDLHNYIEFGAEVNRNIDDQKIYVVEMRPVSMLNTEKMSQDIKKWFWFAPLTVAAIIVTVATIILKF